MTPFKILGILKCRFNQNEYFIKKNHFIIKEHILTMFQMQFFERYKKYTETINKPCRNHAETMQRKHRNHAKNIQNHAINHAKNIP